MKTLSAFMSMSAINNNVPGMTSPIGELSRESGTFAKEVGLYGKPDYPDVRLHSFDCRDDDTMVPLAPAYVTAILALGQWMYTRAITGNFNADKDSCQQKINADFSSTIEIQSIGSMRTNGNYWLPEFLFFKVLGQPDDNVMRIWFSDPAFQAQCDVYEIVVIPVVESLDDLHKDRLTVQNLLSNVTVTGMLEKAAVLTAGYPETYLPAKNYDWVDRNDPTVRYPTPWTVAIYGAAGNNPDVIRQALVDYILENSSYPREDWELIYPDLFRPTEFYIAPIWDRYSLPNQVITAGMFSPTIPYRHMMDYVKQLVAGVTDEFLVENMTAVSLNYKGLMFMSVGNPHNRYDAFRFDELWPKYINLSTMHADFDRIPPNTKTFILFLINLVHLAEEATEYSKLPVGISRMERDGIAYLAASHDDVMYLVAIRNNELVIPLPEVPAP